MWVSLVLLALVATATAQDCGVVSKAFRDQYIVGGEDAPEGNWPWQVSLEWYNPDLDEWRHTCGATLLSDTFAITAAHCWNPARDPFRIVAGQHDRSVTSGNEQIRDLIRFTLHEDYIDSSPWPNDIAILEFEALDLTSDFVSLACLPPTADTEYAGNENCWISGWGLLQGGDPDIPDVLQQANIDVMTQENCRSFWGSNILDTHVCIMEEDGGTIGACNGDSGGPISCQVDGQYDVVGVASWVRSGCLPTWPSAYGRVSMFLDFIEEETGITRQTQGWHYRKQIL